MKLLTLAVIVVLAGCSAFAPCTVQPLSTEEDQTHAALAINAVIPLGGNITLDAQNDYERTIRKVFAEVNDKTKLCTTLLNAALCFNHSGSEALARVTMNVIASEHACAPVMAASCETKPDCARLLRGDGEGI